jgi:hypothetical protein
MEGGGNNIINDSILNQIKEKVEQNTTDISTIQTSLENLVIDKTNVGVGPSVLSSLTTGTGNTAVGDSAGGGPYGVSTSSNCPGISYYNDSIALGANAVITDYNQLMVSPNIYTINVPALAASTGTGDGTILDYDSSANILPSSGTFNSVSKIDTE